MSCRFRNVIFTGIVCSVYPRPKERFTRCISRLRKGGWGIVQINMALRNLQATIRQSSPFRRSYLPSVAFASPYPSMQRHYATTEQSPLISAADLKRSILSKSGPVVLDCTWFMPNVPRDPIAEYKQSRIPGARFFNLDEVIDKSSPYPHMLPSAEDFATAVGIPLWYKLRCLRKLGNNSRGN